MPRAPAMAAACRAGYKPEPIPSERFTMNNHDIEIIEKSTRYSGYFRIDFYRLRHRLFSGGWSGEVQREVFERGQAAAVLPYDPKADAVVLIEQFRIGTMLADLPAWQI